MKHESAHWGNLIKLLSSLLIAFSDFCSLQAISFHFSVGTTTSYAVLCTLLQTNLLFNLNLRVKSFILRFTFLFKYKLMTSSENSDYACFTRQYEYLHLLLLNLYLKS